MGGLPRDLPPPLLKFDGNAETKSADIVASHELRYFLFEFKRSADAISDDNVKPMWRLFETILAIGQHGGEFLEWSKKCHHFVFPEVLKSNLSPHRLSMAMYAAVYYDVVRHKHAKDKAVAPVDNEKRPARTDSRNQAQAEHELLLDLMNSGEYGVSFKQMCWYLRTLSSLIDEGSEDPLKCMLASSDGFFWPIATMKSFHLLSNDFGERLDQEASEEKRTEKYMAAIISHIKLARTIETMEREAPVTNPSTDPDTSRVKSSTPRSRKPAGSNPGAK
jgi:hypothetical protein